MTEISQHSPGGKVAGKLHLLCGLPGSGKTTLAREIEATSGAVRFSPDEWISQLGGDFNDEELRARIEAMQWKLAQQLLVLGNDVVLESGFWSRAERDAFRSTATGIGASVKIHYLNIPMAELKRRIEKRNEHNDPATPKVVLDDLDRWSLLFEPPSNDEL